MTCLYSEYIIILENISKGILKTFFYVSWFFQVYFNHMQQFMNELQQLPEMSKELKNFLEKEWNFMKICSSIRNGEAYAGNRFW